MATSGSPPLIGRVNPATGKVEWSVEDENYDYVQEIARSAYTDMLHDDERNKKYFIGIKKAIETIHARGQQAHVLDIGTGTGLLAMMSAQSGADTVHACEAFEPIGKAARQIVAKNGFGDKIKVVMKRSTELTVGPDGDLPRRANILPAEVFDTELIGEGAIPTYLHAHRHLLTDDCICVPHSATVYAQVVQSTYLEQFHKLQPIKISHSDDIAAPSRMTTCEGAASVFDLQLSQLSRDLFQPITEPLKMLNFNFSKGSFKEKGENRVRAHALTKGTCQLLFMWWELEMDQSGEVLLNTAPTWLHPDGDEAPWRDHWMQAIYFLPKSVDVEEGQSFDVTINHDQYSLWFTVNNNESTVIESPTCQCGAHAIWSRQRFAMLNDESRNQKFISALKKVVSPSTTCLSIGDGSMLPLIAARLGTSRAYSLEPHYLSRKVMQDVVDANHLKGHVTLIPDTAKDLKTSDIESKIDLLISEPYFVSSMLPWHSLYFWFSRTSLKDHLADEATIMPSGARLRAVAIQFEHLWKFHAPVGGDLEGFDVRIFDDLTQKACKDTDAKEEPHHLWEYPGCPLTSDFDLMQFDFTQCVPDKPIDVTGEVSFTRPGTCHGIALWMDFEIDSDTTVTTGLESRVSGPSDGLDWCRTWKQGVHFLKQNPVVKDKQSQKLTYKASFKPNSGNIFFEFQVVDR